MNRAEWFRLADIAQMLVDGAKRDPNPDKTDWIRPWARLQTMLGRPHDAKEWAAQNEPQS